VVSPGCRGLRGLGPRGGGGAFLENPLSPPEDGPRLCPFRASGFTTGEAHGEVARVVVSAGAVAFSCSAARRSVNDNRFWPITSVPAFIVAPPAPSFLTGWALSPEHGSN
jgi:hypothetical protein